VEEYDEEDEEEMGEMRRGTSLEALDPRRK